MTAASSSLSRDEKVEYLALLEARERLNKDRIALSDYESLYGWQRQFNLATASHHVSMLMAANQCVGASTHLDCFVGMAPRRLPILEALAEKDFYAKTLADGYERSEDKIRAYFQGIHSTFRLYLSNGEILDCTGGHQLLTAEGNYLKTVELVCYAGGRHYWHKDGDCLANYDEDGHQYGQPPQSVINNVQAYIQALNGARQHNHSFSQADGGVHIDLCIQAFQCGDLLANPDGLRHALALSALPQFQIASPSAQQMSGLHQIRRQCTAGYGRRQRVDEEQIHRFFDFGVEGSTRIFFAFGLPRLWNKVEILAWHPIGLQPVYDLQVFDTNNYFAAGVVNHNCGKTRTGCLIDSFHLTGEYPEDWEGHRFEGPTTCWLLGYSGEKTRDLLQTKLFGRMSGQQFEGGYIKSSDIVDYKTMTGTPGACREVRVKHKSGGISICQFWSYSQGQHALMGDVVDWFHIDEEPKDKNIYPQVLTRTINGDKGKGGRGILTFTPENGRTELVVQFMDKPGISDYLQRATWNDAPHLSEATKERLLSSYPVWQRDMRSKGEPLLGAGLIFDIDDAKIKVSSFECPDHWYKINGMDFGWDHPQAHIQLWLDKDNDIVYLAHAWKGSKTKPYEAWQQVRPWAKEIPTAWPHDGLQHEKTSGEDQRAGYVDAGWKMLPEHATWPTGGNSVELGLVELYKAMDDGKFKVFDYLSDFFAEKMNYHRDENGHIVKVQDDILSAVRYAWMMRRFAVQAKRKPKAVTMPKTGGWMG